MEEKEIAVRNSDIYGFIDSLVKRIERGEFDGQLSQNMPDWAINRIEDSRRWDITFSSRKSGQLADVRVWHKCERKDGGLTALLGFFVTMAFYFFSMALFGWNNDETALPIFYLMFMLIGPVSYLGFAKIFGYNRHDLTMHMWSAGEEFRAFCIYNQYPNGKSETIDGHAGLHCLKKAVDRRLEMMHSGRGKFKELSKFLKGA